MVKKKLQLSSNGPPFYLVCSRPLFSAPGLLNLPQVTGDHCVIPDAPLVVSCNLLSKMFGFLHGSVFGVRCMSDMIRLQLLRGNDHRNPSQQVVTWR